MTNDLPASYRATRYIVSHGRDKTIIRIGATSSELDHLLNTYGAWNGVFLTAWNPWSRPSERDRNRRASLELATVLDRLGHRFLPAVNLADDPDWSEESYFVFDLSIEEALMLARAYGQNAVVLAEEGQAARLLWAENPH